MPDTERPHVPEGPVVGVVVVTHGMLATELLNAAETIVGDLPQFTAVSIGWHDDVPVATSTPSNLAMTFLEAGRIEVVTGVNLPMLIKLARTNASRDVLAAAKAIADDGRQAIRVASDLLRGTSS